MKILKGKHAGGGWKPHQWANDWIMADDGRDHRNVIVRPTSVQLEDDEYWLLREDYTGFWQRGDRRAGMFWELWQLEIDGTFTRRRAQ